MSEAYPRLAPAGEAALVLELGARVDAGLNRRVHALARALAKYPELVDLAPGNVSLLVAYDPARLDYDRVAGLVRAELAALPRRLASRAPLRELPTAYGGEYGPDLPAVARRLGLTEEEVVRLHAGRLYRVYLLGFAPGYAYLGELPGQLALPRLATPRLAVPAGSVAIAGRQTGIYSVTSPGGWHVLGRTPVRLFDPTREPPTYLAPGDRVRFVPIAAADFSAVEAAGEAPPACLDPAIEVVAPGLLTSVQDLGRWGYARYGVPTAGAMDSFAARAANLLVGNAPDAAVLEVTLAGPALRFRRACLVAATGADLSPHVDQAAIPGWTACAVQAGAVLRFGKRRVGLRSYLAVGGGIDVPRVLGSRSTYLRGGFGGHHGRALQAGDLLAVGPAQPECARLAGRCLPPASRPRYSRAPTVRVVLGPHDDRFPAAALAAFLSAAWAVGPASDRMGYRLQGPTLARHEPADLISMGMPLGGIQVPGDGQPIVLLYDHQTTGGYPLIATVIQADLPLLAQLAPGDTVRFQAVSVEEGQAAYRAMLVALAPG